MLNPIKLEGDPFGKSNAINESKIWTSTHVLFLYIDNPHMYFKSMKNPIIYLLLLEKVALFFFDK